VPYGFQKRFGHVYDRHVELFLYVGPEQVHRFRSAHVSTPLQARLATATQIPPAGHLAMIAAVQQITDEAVAETVNLASAATIDDVLGTFWQPYDRFASHAQGAISSISARLPRAPRSTTRSRLNRRQSAQRLRRSVGKGNPGVPETAGALVHRPEATAQPIAAR
jgi:hypothetical protein